MELQTYETLVIDSNNASRNRLKQAALAVINIKTVQLASANPLDKALSGLGGSGRYDVIFISAAYPQDEIARFIPAAKKTTKGEDSAYILVLKGDNQDQSVIASTLMIGADGIICEPYSVERLNEITLLAAKIRRERVESRQKAAISLLMTTLVKEYDRITLFLIQDVDKERILNKFSRNCQPLNQFIENSLELYYQCALELFSRTEAPIVTNYTGASKRLKEKMDRKIREDLENEMKKEESSEGI